jgi:hypothetical protein
MCNSHRYLPYGSPPEGLKGNANSVFYSNISSTFINSTEMCYYPSIHKHIHSSHDAEFSYIRVDLTQHTPTTFRSRTMYHHILPT